MSWDDSKEYLKTYRKERVKELNNKQKGRWSTHEVDSLKTLVDKFSSTAENSAWQVLYSAPKAQFVKLEAARLKIHFLAGCRRDIRQQFACGTDSRPRAALDWGRFEFMRLAYHALKHEMFDKFIKSHEGGAETL